MVLCSYDSLGVFKLFGRSVLFMSLKAFGYVADDVPCCFRCMVEVVPPAFVGVAFHPFHFGFSDGFS